MISVLTPDRKQELEDFLVSVFGQDIREIARTYIKCSLSNDFRRPFFMIYILDGKIVGAAAYSEELFTINVYGISWVSVDERCRGKGIGKSLIEVCIHAVQEKIMSPSSVIVATYKGKTKLYEDLGFNGDATDYAQGKFLTRTIYPVEK